LRFRKLTQRGPVWFVEAMFPGYLFARFNYPTQRRAVESSHGTPRNRPFWRSFGNAAGGFGEGASITRWDRRGRHHRFLGNPEHSPL